MTRNEAREYVRGRMEEYLSDKGINVNKEFRCLSPDHNDEHPSMRFDRKRQKVHCFSCGVDYDMFDLIGIDYNITDEKEKFRQAYEIYKLDVETSSSTPRVAPKPRQKNEPAPLTKQQKETAKPITSFLKACQADLEKTAYLQAREISFETARRFGLGFSMNMNKDFKVPWPAIIIPTGEGSFVARNVNPNAEKADRIRKFGASKVWNYQATQEGDYPVFIVEGEFDMLSVEELDMPYHAVALGSTANIVQFVNLCREKPPKCPGFVLLLDNDATGKEATTVLSRELSKLEIPFIGPLDGVNLGDYNDPNDFLRAEFEEFRSAVSDYAELFKVKAAEAKLKILGDNAAAHIEAFQDGIKASASTEAVASGFNELDSQLDGGFYEGLYIVGAISSLGKTTFVQQIGDQIALNGTDVLIFSLEMSRFELMAKSISRLTLELCGGETNNAKTTRGILVGKRYELYSNAEKVLITQAVETYEQYAVNVYINEGQGDIGTPQVRARIDKHLSFTGRSPFVIVDYLQLLAPYDPRSTDKQNTDKAVLELKRISRDFKIPVLAISSFNRQNYSQAVSMEAFKESGCIEYSADVLIGLQAEGAGEKNFDIDKAKRADPRNVELKILKNRNGRTGGVIKYLYYTKFNKFEEFTLLSDSTN